MLAAILGRGRPVHRRGNGSPKRRGRRWDRAGQGRLGWPPWLCVLQGGVGL